MLTPDLNYWVEGQGRTKMREALIKSLQPQVQTWLDNHRAAFKDIWQAVFELESQKLKKEIPSEISGYYSGLALALGSAYGINDLERVQMEIGNLG